MASKKTPEEKQEAERAYKRRNRQMYNEAAKRFFHRTKDLPEYAAKRACRAAITRLVRDAKVKKVASTEVMHGYTFAEFRAHIESLFEPWMTWANHGEWHVDHIVPVANFIARGVTDASVINALSNLRPLRAVDNLSRPKKAESAPLPTSILHV